MSRQIHEFNNGVKIFDDHLTHFQRERYKRRNVHEAEEENIFLRLISVVPVKGCFLNIGAAAGYYSLLAKKLSPNLAVHAVEPLEEHRKFFGENIRLNGFRPKDFIIHNEAVSSVNGNDLLLDQGYGSVLLRETKKIESPHLIIRTIFQTLISRIRFKTPQSSEKRKFRVRTVSLDCLLKIVGKPVDLLVMDVQGLEADVLKGGGNSLHTGKVNSLMIGTHGREIHHECLDILKAHGFTVTYEDPAPREQPDGIIAASLMPIG